MSEEGKPGKLVNYRNIVMDQCRLADELNLPFSDTARMSILDRHYAIEYLDMKAKAISELTNK